MRVVVGVVSALLVCGPAWACRPQVQVEVRDLAPKFLRFYEAVQAEHGADADRRWALWQTHYGFAAVPPTEQGQQMARQLLDAAWPRYPAALEQIRAGASGMRPAPEDTLTRIACLLKLERPLKLDLLAYVGGFEDNAFTAAPDGEITVALPLESPPQVRALLMAHEFTHAVHIVTAGLSGGWERSIAQTVVQEGLAMRVVQRLYPDLPATAYVEHSQGWLAQAQAAERAILAGIRPSLAAMDSDTVYRYTVGSGTTGLEREAYYAGWRVVGQWLDQGRSLEEIARIPSARMPEEVGRTLDALLAAGPEQ